MHLVLITTTDMQSDRRADLARMIGSVEASRPPGVPLTHYLLLQRCQEDERLALADTIPYPAVVLASAGRMSLSAARNTLLARARADGRIDDDALVGFPDDDCWYEPGFLGRLLETFEQDPALGLLLSRVSLAPTSRWSGADLCRANGTLVLRRASSNAMFIRGDVVSAIGDFDETLGLGTPRHAGEDTDFALRAWLAAKRTVYVDLPLVGHREPDLSSITKYFNGNMVVAARYAPRSPRLFWEFVRKFGVGGYLVLRQRLKPSEFLAAVQGSMGRFGRSSG